MSAKEKKRIENRETSTERAHRLGKEFHSKISMSLKQRGELQGAILHELERYADAKVAAFQATAAACVPTNWLDPLLTGSEKVIHDSSAPDIQRLLLAVKARIEALPRSCHETAEDLK